MLSNAKKNCIRCGNTDHANRDCKDLISSFGLIVYRRGQFGQSKGRMYPYHEVDCECRRFAPSSCDKVKCDNELLFFLVERKDTIGFLNIIQGLYSENEPYRSRKLVKYISELTCEERLKLQNIPFRELWKIGGSKKKDYKKCERKFMNIDLKTLLRKNVDHYQEGDYLMPKGKIKYYETKVECALREFAEESGYDRLEVEIQNIPPYEEIFSGLDGKNYKNVFFVAEMKKNRPPKTILGEDISQSKEVRNMGWFNIDECRNILRDSHYKKLEILNSVHSLLLSAKQRKQLMVNAFFS